MTAYLSRRSTVGTGSAPVYTDSPPAFDDLEPIESGQYGRPAFYRARSNTTVSGLIAAPETRASFKLAGKRLTTPLISVEAVKAHLRLLAAFNQLRKDVMNHKQPELEAAGITDEDRWSIFLVKAHTRFEAWLNSRTCEPECYDLPMPDFLFMWYTYLVHPRAYHEDNGQTSLARGFDVSQAASEIDPLTHRYMPVAADHTKRKNYEDVIGYALDVDLDLKADATLADWNNVQPVTCPRCYFVDYVPYLSLEDPTKGYAHRHFSTSCRECNQNITREVLAVARFALSLLFYIQEGMPLSGTTLNPQSGRPDGIFAATLNAGMTSGLRRLCEGCTTAADIGDRFDWSFSNIQKAMRRSPIGLQLPQRVDEVLKCYSQPHFSVDLVSAAKRQSLFIQELEELGWLDNDAFEIDPTAIKIAVARYHQYLDLMSSNTSRKTVVPTIDINVVMQAHQLDARDYRSFLIQIIGRLPDNNKSMSQESLIDAFDSTAKAFKARFNQAYTMCGCRERNGLSAVRMKAAKDATILEDVVAVLRSSQRCTPHSLALRNSDMLRMATHPCTHNMSLNERKPVRVAKKRSPLQGHRNSLVDPSDAFAQYLETEIAFGYGYKPANAGSATIL